MASNYCQPPKPSGGGRQVATDLLKTVVNGQGKYRPVDSSVRYSTSNTTIALRKKRPGVVKYLSRVVGIKKGSEIANVRARSVTAHKTQLILQRHGHFNNLHIKDAKDAGAGIVQAAELADIFGQTLVPKTKTPAGLYGKLQENKFVMCSRPRARAT
jgi:hypothetical protein